MRYLVNITVSPRVENETNASGGPGKMVESLLAKFKPEASYLTPGARMLGLVADLDPQDMVKLMLICSRKAGTRPTFTPVVPMSELPQVAVNALARANELLGT